MSCYVMLWLDGSCCPSVIRRHEWYKCFHTSDLSFFIPWPDRLCKGFPYLLDVLLRSDSFVGLDFRGAPLRVQTCIPSLQKLSMATTFLEAGGQKDLRRNEVGWYLINACMMVPGSIFLHFIIFIRATQVCGYINKSGLKLVAFSVLS